MHFARTAVAVFCLLHGASSHATAEIAEHPGCRGEGCRELQKRAAIQEQITRLQAETDTLREELLQARTKRRACDGHRSSQPAPDGSPHARLLGGSGAPEGIPSNQSHTHPGQPAHGESHAHETLLFLFGAVTVGTIVLHLTTIPALHSLQFTVVLFALGVGFGILTEQGALEAFPMLRRSYDAWVAVDPHLLLFTFLPALLCGDAMTIDTHIAKRCAAQCWLLAGPGVLIGAFLTTLVVYYVLPYGWDAATSCTVGSILAATDPVAVVSLLKELGASPVLTILIQGESLLNDGIAIVLFTVAYNIAGGETYSVGRLAGFAAKSTLLAGCLGALIGFVFYLWIRRSSDKLCESNALIQISLTIVCAYWSFIIAEGVFHTSGVLSTVAAALVLAHKMWPVLVERGTMHQIWHVIEMIGNILVFFLAGVLVGRAMQDIPFKDYLSLILLYVAVTFIRLFVLLLFYPILNRIGERVLIEDIIIMTWGGLRGMVGLALGILVQKDLAGGKLSQTDGDRVLFLVGSVAALTMIVNATTCPALTRVLGITRAPEARNVLMRNVADRARLHTLNSMESLMNCAQASKTCSPGLVKELVGHLMQSGQEELYGEGTEKQVWSPDHLGDNAELSTDFEQKVSKISSTGVSSKTVTFSSPDAETHVVGTCRALSRSSSRSSASLGNVAPNEAELQASQASSLTSSGPTAALHRESVQSGAAYAKVVPSEEVAEDRPRLRPSGTRRSVASCSSSRSTSSRASRVAGIQYKHSLSSHLFGCPEPPQVETLWANFNKAKMELLNTGSAIVTFKYGKQLDAIKSILKTETIQTDRIEVVREVFLETVRAHYWEQLTEGRFMVGSSVPAILFNSVNIAKDHCDDKLTDWDVLKKDIYIHTETATANAAPGAKLLDSTTGRSDELFQRCKNAKSFHTRWQAWMRFRLQEWRNRRRFAEQAFAIQLINAFIEAQIKAQDQTAKYFGDGEDVDSSEEAFVIVESQTQIFQAATMRGKISQQVQLKVNTMWHVHCLAEHYRNFVLEVHETGVLQAKEADALLTPVSKAMRQFNKDRKNIYELIAKEKREPKIKDLTQATLMIQRYFRRRKMARMHRTNLTVMRSMSDVKCSDADDCVGLADTCERHLKVEPSEISDVEVAEVRCSRSASSSPTVRHSSRQSHTFLS